MCAGIFTNIFVTDQHVLARTAGDDFATDVCRILDILLHGGLLRGWFLFLLDRFRNLASACLSQRVLCVGFFRGKLVREPVDEALHCGLPGRSGYFEDGICKYSPTRT